MAQYEVHCDGVSEARCFQFSTEVEAIEEAQKICDQYHVEARVMLVIGMFVPTSEWISNGVPGYR